MIELSVVVCTYNRAAMLSGALESLAQQTLDKGFYEIIVVDNNSTDNTRVLAEALSQRYPNVRYCLEPQQDLSNARNRGWRLARGEYVAYTDDDCKTPEEWREVACDVIERVWPAVLGGSYLAFYNTPKPRWFKDSYGSHEEGSGARVLGKNEYLCGGNIYIRRRFPERLVRSIAVRCNRRCWK